MYMRIFRFLTKTMVWQSGPSTLHVGGLHSAAVDGHNKNKWALPSHSLSHVNPKHCHARLNSETQKHKLLKQEKEHVVQCKHASQNEHYQQSD